MPLAVAMGSMVALLTVTERIEEAMTPNSGSCCTARLVVTEALERSCWDRRVTVVSFQLHEGMRD